MLLSLQKSLQSNGGFFYFLSIIVNLIKVSLKIITFAYSETYVFMIRYSITLLLLLCTIHAVAQKQKFTISGYITDEQTGESLIGANIFITNPSTIGTTSNAYGFYTLTLEKGRYELKARFVGYEEWATTVDLQKNITLNIRLKPKVITTSEVVITDKLPDQNVKSTEMGVVEMPVEMIKKLPVVFGEVDILKTIQLKPGIQSAGEGLSGLYIRGGGPDQNLILLDEAVVYNASHLFGFFSVFNADAINNIEVYKGMMPAYYGGRLASVLDISMKEGNNRRYAASGGLGLISSRLTVEGPLKKDTSSFIISGRRTYADVVFRPFVRKTSPLRQSAYYFYDLNAKVNWRLSNKDRLFLSGYFGRDIFDLLSTEDNFSNDIAWGNATAVARWNHIWNAKLFSNTSIIYSTYQFGFDAIQDIYEFKLKSRIEDINGKLDFTFIPSPSHTIKFGFNYIYHIFTPTSASARTYGEPIDLGPEIKLYSHEGAIYLNDAFDLTDLIRIDAGVRLSTFFHVGPFTRYVKEPMYNTTIDSTEYATGEIVRNYTYPEPRLMARFLIDETSSIKAGFVQNYQYIHLVSISSVSLPTDLWMPSTDRVKPQLGRQYSIGYFKNFYKNMFESSVELYYKKMYNLVEFKEGALIEDNIRNNIDNNFTFGEGESYGVELFINKQMGKLTGWIGYTLAKTTRFFPEINDGKPFPAKYDRRHDVSVVLMYDINPQLNVSLVWVYATGNTTTLPVSRYIIGGNIINEYGPRNSFRLPPYHRMDISVNWNPKPKKQRTWHSSWNFSIYNLYNRKNPYYIYFDTKGDITQGYLEVKAKQVSLFPLLPSITYNFKF